jgi:transposase
MSRRRKHRLWTVEEKRSICLQARSPGVSIAQVARRYALNTNLIHKWLRDPRFAAAASIEDDQVFLPVEIDDARDREVATLPISPRCGSGRVEIVLAAGHRVSVDGPFDGDALAGLLKVLAQS